MAYDDKKYLLRMSSAEYELLARVAKNMRRSIKDTILYSVEQQENMNVDSKEEN
jgi:hypothetical protein